MVNKPLVLFIGNILYSDDRIGILVGEKLKEELESEGFDVKILERMGYTLIDIIADRETVVIVDSIKSGKKEVGEVYLLDAKEMQTYTPLSPHSSGLPEMLNLMKSLNIKLPKNIYVIAIEVKDPYTISEELTPELKSKFYEIKKKVYEEIRKLLGKDKKFSKMS